MRRLCIVAGALVIALGVVPGAVAAKPSFAGTWTTTITRDPLFHGGINGTYVDTFANGKTTVKQNGKIAVRGTYKLLSGSRVQVRDVSGVHACKGVGLYSYKVTATKLTFKLIKDPSPTCLGRVHALTDQPYKRAA
jgi:hypothetical protein